MNRVAGRLTISVLLAASAGVAAVAIWRASGRTPSASRVSARTSRRSKRT